MNSHKQLTKEQRYQIAALKKARHNNKTIASLVGVSESTISREIKRNSGNRGYRPEQAHQKALYRKRQATKAIKMTASAILLINNRIRFGLRTFATEF